MLPCRMRAQHAMNFERAFRDRRTRATHSIGHRSDVCYNSVKVVYRDVQLDR